MKTKIIICGVGGRMGSRLISLAKEDFEIIGALTRQKHILSDEVSRLTPVFDSLEEIKTDDWPVIIDFTSPANSLENARLAATRKWPMVIGTTGFTEKDFKIFRELAGEIPLLISSNMSRGVNALLGFITALASRLGNGYDVDIIETHHCQKKDAPSGTAKSLAAAVASAHQDDFGSYSIPAPDNRNGCRVAGEIKLHSIRAGTVIGRHTIIFQAANESIEIRHDVANRDVFAEGALCAAKWLSGVNSPGLYSMRDVYGL